MRLSWEPRPGLAAVYTRTVWYGSQHRARVRGLLPPPADLLGRLLPLVPPVGPPPFVAHRGRDVNVRDWRRVGELQKVRLEQADLVVGGHGGVGGAEDRACAHREAGAGVGLRGVPHCDLEVSNRVRRSWRHPGLSVGPCPGWNHDPVHEHVGLDPLRVLVIVLVRCGEADCGDVGEGDAVRDAGVPGQPVMEHHGCVTAQDSNVELLCLII